MQSTFTFTPQVNLHFLEAPQSCNIVRMASWLVSGRSLRAPCGGISHSQSGPIDSQSSGFSTERISALPPATETVPAFSAANSRNITNAMCSSHQGSRIQREKELRVIKKRTFQLNIVLCLLTVTTQTSRHKVAGSGILRLLLFQTEAVGVNKAIWQTDHNLEFVNVHSGCLS